MDSPVTEKMCLERNQHLSKKLDDLTAEVKAGINKAILLWVGNGEIGAKYKLDTMWNNHKRKQSTSQGMWDWGFRFLITTLVGILLLRK